MVRVGGEDEWYVQWSLGAHPDKNFELAFRPCRHGDDREIHNGSVDHGCGPARGFGEGEGGLDLTADVDHVGRQHHANTHAVKGRNVVALENVPRLVAAANAALGPGGQAEARRRSSTYGEKLGAGYVAPTFAEAATGAHLLAQGLVVIDVDNELCLWVYAKCEFVRQSAGQTYDTIRWRGAPWAGR